MLDGVREDTVTFTRDLPYGWDRLVENLVDPAHIPWVHHGLQGQRDDGIPMNMSMSRDTTVTKSGFSFDFADRTLGMRRAGTPSSSARPMWSSKNACFEMQPGPAARQPPKFRLTLVCIPIRAG
jgi:phenylpropionate dioxygenase-like ring-hydroxylating dioxygenase large terminal subunit